MSASAASQIGILGPVRQQVSGERSQKRHRDFHASVGDAHPKQYNTDPQEPAIERFPDKDGEEPQECALTTIAVLESAVLDPHAPEDVEYSPVWLAPNNLLELTGLILRRFSITPGKVD